MNKINKLCLLLLILVTSLGVTSAQISNVSCNTSTGTPWVQGSFNNLSVSASSGIFISQWSNTNNVIDNNNSNTTSTTIFGIGTRSLKVTDSVNDYPAGSYVGYKIDLDDLVTTFSITLKTYLNGVAQESKDITTKTSLINLHGAYEVGMLTTKNWDAIELQYTSLGLTGSITVYHAVVKKFCAGADLVCNTETKMVNNAYGTYINKARTGSDGLTISSTEDEENIIDNDPSNFGKLTNLIGKLGRAYVSVADATKVHPAGTFAGYEIENAIASGINFFNYITVSTYLNGTLQETKTGTALFIHIPKLDFGNRRTFGFETTKAFNEVQITMNQPSGVTLGTTKVFSLILSKPCEAPDLVCNTMTKITRPNFPVNINATKTGVSGIAAIAATVANADFVIDENNTNYATITVPKSLGTNAALSVKKSLADFPIGTYAGFDVEHYSLFNKNFLNAVSITTYNNGVLQETVVGSAQLFSAGSDIIAPSGRNVLGFITKKAFDEIRLNISSVASFDIGTTKVYNMVAMKPCEKQINCNSSYYWNQPEFPVVINMERTGVYNLACVDCSIKDTGKLINNNPNDFASIIMAAGVGNHGSISVVDPSAIYPSGTFAGYTINDKYFPVQFDFKEFTTVKTYLKGVLQESKTSVDLFDKSLLIPIWGTGSRNVGFYTTKPFDEIQLVVNSIASIANKIDVYGVYVDTRSSNGDSLSCLAKIVTGIDNQTIEAGQQGTVSVLANDTINDAPATSNNVNLSQASTTNSGVNIDPTTGLVTVAPGTPMGTYVVTYQICDKANPTNCATGTANITVPNPVIDAIPDTFATIPTNLGGKTPSVLLNDKLAGQPATLSNVNVTPGTLPAGVTYNTADATFTVAPGTTPGSYPVSYTICDKVNTGNCDTAIATVVVGASTIVVDAVNDNLVGSTSGGTTSVSVLANDTVNGQPAVVGGNANVVLTPGTMPAGWSMTSDGRVNVPANTTKGSYIVTYTICGYADMSVCDTATATVDVKGQADMALDLSTSNTVIVLGNTTNIFYKVTNVGVEPSTGLITVIAMKPAGINSFTANPVVPQGWSVQQQQDGSYIFTTNKVMNPGDNDTLVMNYVSSDVQINLARTFIGRITNGSGGETNFSNNVKSINLIYVVR
ncbi:hypothetical protein [Chryseobacterium sp.]|uniref:hypothetical protein n=1 Tax=Chryseobacterium sp. TaxID=1871047 RepID=UPI0038900791